MSKSLESTCLILVVKSYQIYFEIQSQCSGMNDLTLRDESSQTNVMLPYKLLASILSAVCSVIQQSYYVLHLYYTLYDGKYDCTISTH